MNITKLTEQCSPLQCFEDVGQGQTVANTQGADTYTECRCENLFSLSDMAVPILLWALPQWSHDSRYTKALSDFKPLIEDTIARFRAAQKKVNDRDREGGYRDLVAVSKFLDEQVIVPLKGELLRDRQNEVLLNDLVVTYRYGAIYYKEIRQFKKAAQYYLKAAKYVAKYAKAVNRRLERESKGMSSPDMDRYDIETYEDLVEGAVKAKELVALSPEGNSADFTKIAEIYTDMVKVLRKNGFDKDVSKFMDQSDHARTKAVVYQWMDKNVKGWRSGADMGIINAHFKRTLEIVEYGSRGDGVVSPETVGAAIRRHLNKETNELKQRLLKLADAENSQSMAAIEGELSRLYYEAGEMEAAVKMKAAEVVHRVELIVPFIMKTGDYNAAITASIELIRLARNANLPKSEGDGYRMLATSYMLKSEWANALEAYGTAIERYKTAGYKGAELKNAVQGKGTVLARMGEGARGRKGAIGVGDGRPRAIGVEGEGGLGAIGTERKGEEGKGHEKEERKGRERPGK